MALEVADGKYEFEVNVDCAKLRSYHADVKVRFQIGDESEVF